MVMDLGKTSFFYHRPLKEHLLRLFVVFFCIWMTFCSKDLWVFDHSSTDDMQMKLTFHDKLAVVGKVFQYHIPYKNEEKSFSLHVTEAGSEFLPDWLKFNRDDSTLYGIATVQDIGYHYISVTITLMNNESSRINFSDVFTVDVVLSSPADEESNIGSYDNFNIEPFMQLTYEPRLEPCTPDQPRFSATVIVSTSFQQLNGQARVDIVLRFAEFVFRSPVDLTLSPRKSASVTRLLKKSIVAAGPGNVDEGSKKEEGVEITWTLACNSHFRVDYFTRIMEHNILSGTLVDVIGYSVLGWYITRDEPKIKSSRFRRQANDIINETPVPTPSQTMVLPTKVQSTVSFSFPSTLINFDSTVSIEFTQSNLIRTVDVTSTLGSSFMTSSPFSSSPVVLTSSPAFVSSSSDGISVIVMTMFTSGSLPLQTFMTSSPFSSSPVIRTSSQAIASSSSNDISDRVTTMFTSGSLPLQTVFTSDVVMSTSSVVTTLAPASSFILGMTASVFNVTLEPSSATYNTISQSIPYLPYTSSPVGLSSQTISEVSSDFSYYSSMQTSYTTKFSTNMFTEPSTIMVPISTESIAISSLLFKSDIPPSSLVSSSLPQTFQLITSSEFEISTTPLLSSMLTSSSSFMSPSMSSEFYSRHEMLSSTQFQLYSSTYSPRSSYFYQQMLTSSVEDNLATSSLLEEYSFSVSFALSSSQLPTSVSSRLMDLSTTIIPSSFLMSTTIDSRISSVLPTSAVAASSIRESSVSVSSAFLSSDIISSSFEGYLTSSPSLVTSSLREASNVFFTMSPTLPLSILPSVFISSQQIEMETFSLEFTLSSSQVVSTSIYFSSSLIPTSTFITPSPSSFPPLITIVPSMHPTPALSTSFMAPSISIPLTSVQQMISSEIMPTPSVSSVMISSSVLVTPEPVNQGPVVLNAINHITILIGRVLTFSIPADTFYDPEDGDTRNLALELLTGDNQLIEGSSWVRLDAKLQIIYGLALDAMLIDQKIVYNLFATDSEGKNVFDALYIEVLPDPYTYTHQFLITFSNNYDEFSSDVNNAINVCQRLADYYGDPSTDKITVLSISEGSVIYAYANNSISNNICDMDAINREYSRLAYANGSVNVGVRIIMQPKYPVVSVQKHLKGVCLPKPQTTDVPNVIAEKRSSKQVVSITIPAFLCALLLLLVGICVCCCYKRKRPGEDFLLREERNMFVRNRKPIFLDNELESRPIKATKPVVLPKDISPFLPSPRAGSAPLEARPSPPSYLNEAYEKDDPDSGIPMPFFPPPAYSLQPTFNRLPSSYLDPPGYRLPPPYESEDVGMFETSKI